jgi:steroid delta-isomerase-like uncharacterized protein
MSTQDPTQVAREIVTLYSASNWAGIKKLLTQDAIYNEVGSQRRVQGPDAILPVLQEWKKGMTDSSGKVTNAFAAGDQVALQITWQGTHDGPVASPAGSLPPSGKHQTTAAVMIVKVKGTQVQQIDHYFDMLTFLTQIGAMPALAGRNRGHS